MTHFCVSCVYGSQHFNSNKKGVHFHRWTPSEAAWQVFLNSGETHEASLAWSLYLLRGLWYPAQFHEWTALPRNLAYTPHQQPIDSAEIATEFKFPTYWCMAAQNLFSGGNFLRRFHLRVQHNNVMVRESEWLSKFVSVTQLGKVR